jgi:transposase-like protein
VRGAETGLRGGRSKGKKVLVGVAVERRDHGFGRIRMAVLPTASILTLQGFLRDNVERGSTVVTDGLQAYKVASVGYTHDRIVGRDTSLPGVHRVAALLKRWLLGTHQGSVDQAHLPAYLDEFVLRFNRRPSRSRGLLFYRLLQLAVGWLGVLTFVTGLGFDLLAS